MDRNEFNSLRYQLWKALDTLNRPCRAEDREATLELIDVDMRERTSQLKALYIDYHKHDTKSRGVEEFVRLETNPELYFLNMSSEEFEEKWGLHPSEIEIASGQRNHAILADLPQLYPEEEQFLKGFLKARDKFGFDFDVHAIAFLTAHIGRLELVRRKVMKTLKRNYWSFLVFAFRRAR